MVVGVGVMMTIGLTLSSFCAFALVDTCAIQAERGLFFLDMPIELVARTRCTPNVATVWDGPTELRRLRQHDHVHRCRF